MYFANEMKEQDPALRKEAAENAISFLSKAVVVYPDYYAAQCDLGASYFDIPYL